MNLSQSRDESNEPGKPSPTGREPRLAKAHGRRCRRRILFLVVLEVIRQRIPFHIEFAVIVDIVVLVGIEEVFGIDGHLFPIIADHGRTGNQEHHPPVALTPCPPYNYARHGGVAELAYAGDLKSPALRAFRVRIPAPLPAGIPPRLRAFRGGRARRTARYSRTAHDGNGGTSRALARRALLGDLSCVAVLKHGNARCDRPAQCPQRTQNRDLPDRPVAQRHEMTSVTSRLQRVAGADIRLPASRCRSRLSGF